MRKVLVTGASGFIAEHCIIELLKNNYSVKGSLRSMNREQEVREAIKTEIDDANLENDITSSIQTYEPRAQVLSINSIIGADNNEVRVTVRFLVISTSQQDTVEINLTRLR